jgi:hypothetical protein
MCDRNIVTYLVIGLVIGFIGLLQLITTKNYSSTTDSHTLQCTIALQCATNMLRQITILETISYSPHYYWNMWKYLKCCCIYCDNFFSGPSLFQKLKTNDMCILHYVGRQTDIGLQTCNTKKSQNKALHECYEMYNYIYSGRHRVGGNPLSLYRAYYSILSSARMA